MKKHLTLIAFVAAATIGIYSCSKEQELPASSSSQSGNRAERQGRELTFAEWLPQNENRLHEVNRAEIIAFEDRETRKRVYGVLPPARKAYVWKEKYAELLASNAYSQQQKDFINLLLPYLTTDFFALDEVPAQIHNEIQQLRERGKPLFPGVLLRMIMADLENPAGIKNAGGGGSTGVDQCDCSVRSDWCDIPVDVGGRCNPDACNRETRSGCGTWWWYRCQGDCTL